MRPVSAAGGAGGRGEESLRRRLRVRRGERRPSVLEVLRPDAAAQTAAHRARRVSSERRSRRVSEF